MANHNQHTVNFGSNVFLLSGDTIPTKPIPSDSINTETKDTTLSASTLNPVMFKPRVAKVKVQVDTVCHICPKGEPVSLLQSINDNLNSHEFLPETTLYDEADFAKLHKVTTPVFIETTSNISRKSLNYPYEKGIESASTFSEWAFLPIIALLLLIAFVKNAYGKYIVSLSQGAIHLFYAEKIFQEKSLFGQKANLFLDLLYFLSLPFVVLLSANYFDKSIISRFNPFIALLFILLAFFTFRIFRFISIKSIGYISNRWDEVNLIYFNQLLYLRIIGLINIPILFFLAYTEGTTHKIILLIVLFLIGLLLIVRLLRTLQVFIKKGFSIFYFLLYLCALEIMPLLILVKEANR